MESKMANEVEKETGITALQFAEFLLTQEVKTKFGIKMTLTRTTLQKHLYLIQGYHLLFAEKGLFSEDFQTHPTGYIIPEVWEVYRHYGYKSIPHPTSAIRFDGFTSGSQEIIQAVLQSYGCIDGKTFEELMHQEEIWVRKGLGEKVEKHEMLKEFQDNYQRIEKGQIR